MADTVYLRCSDRDCGATLDARDNLLACPRCRALLDVVVPIPQIDPKTLRRTWSERRRSHDPLDASGVWRFREFLPSYPPSAVVSLREGNTPLLDARHLPAASRVSRLLFKHLGWNPTGSFKDTGMTVGVTDATHSRATCVACASTGNTAASMAAYAARAGLSARAYLPKGAVSGAKLAQAIDYGAEIVEVDGNFDAALAALVARRASGEYFVNSLNPFRLEGQKTVMFELLDQLEWVVPDYIVVPGGNLGNVSAFGKAIEELEAAALIAKRPRLVVVQAQGANPFVRVWRSGASVLEPIADPQTEATAIRIGAPASWKKAVRALRLTNGLAIDVSEDAIGAAKAAIGREGIGCEPASATTVAAVEQLTAEGRIDRDATVVAILTGHVLKDPDFILRHQPASGDRSWNQH